MLLATGHFNSGNPLYTKYTKALDHRVITTYFTGIRNSKCTSYAANLKSSDNWKNPKALLNI